METIDKLPYASLMLDKRTSKKSKSSIPIYKVKLYVYDPNTGKSKRYATKFFLTEMDFVEIWEGKIQLNTNDFTTIQRAKSKAQKTIREQMQSLVSKANAEINTLEGDFTFEDFEKRLFTKTIDHNNVFWYYNDRIEEFKSLDKLNTSEWYKNSMNSLKDYLKHIKKKDINHIDFESINTKWVQHYEKFMNDSRKSRTTISMYLRALRAIFHLAKKEKISSYPFGDKKYKIKKSSKVKKALSKEDLSKLWYSVPKSPLQDRARDFWFFSMLCNGMNLKDIMYLRFGDFQEKKFSFVRKKTIDVDEAPIVIKVSLTEHAKMVIKEYGNVPNGNPMQLVFPFINESETAYKQYIRVKSLTSSINKHIKKLAKEIGIDENISLYYARHSFANLKNKLGHSISKIQEALGHSNPKTTQIYLQDFEDDEIEKDTNEIMLNIIS